MTKMEVRWGTQQLCHGRPQGCHCAHRHHFGDLCITPANNKLSSKEIANISERVEEKRSEAAEHLLLFHFASFLMIEGKLLLH